MIHYRERYTRIMVPLLVFAFLGMLAAPGCSKGMARYHFAAVSLEEDKPRLKFYRVTISGDSSLMKSSLQTGFYNAEALYALFGEVSSKAQANSNKSTLGDYTVSYDPATQQYTVMQDSLFTIVYGTDADALAEQITAFANNQATGDQIARLIAGAAGGQAYQAKAMAEHDTNRAKSSARELAKTFTSIADKISKDITLDKAEEAVEDAIQQAEAAEGSVK